MSKGVCARLSCCCCGGGGRVAHDRLRRVVEVVEAERGGRRRHRGWRRLRDLRRQTWRLEGRRLRLVCRLGDDGSPRGSRDDATLIRLGDGGKGRKGPVGRRVVGESRLRSVDGVLLRIRRRFRRDDSVGLRSARGREDAECRRLRRKTGMRGGLSNRNVSKYSGRTFSLDAPAPAAV